MKKLVVSIIIVLSLVFCGCGAQSKGEVEEFPNGFNDNDVYEYVDPETGVNYLVFIGYYKGGITVRYNSDGTVMVTDPTEN